MVYGYIRVSTTMQNVDRQVDALKLAGVDRIFIDKITGTKANRPELNKMFDMLRKGDKVVVTELARFSRSLKDCISLIEKLNAMEVEFKSLKETIDTTTPMGKFFFYVSCAFAQLERDIIVERTNEGIKSARMRGRTGGRPKVDDDKLKKALTLYYTKKFKIKEIVEMTGVSKTVLYKYLKQQK